jgi:hypothetical protein
MIEPRNLPSWIAFGALFSSVETRSKVRAGLIAIALVALAAALGGDPRGMAALLLGGSIALLAASWTHAVVALRRDAVARRGQRFVALWPWGFDLLEAGVYFAACALHLEPVLAAAFVGKMVAFRARSTSDADAGRVQGAEPFVGSLMNLAAALAGAGIRLAL